MMSGAVGSSVTTVPLLSDALTDSDEVVVTTSGTPSPDAVTNTLNSACSTVPSGYSIR